MAVIRVLIVDENDYMRAGLKASLESLDRGLVEAGHGTERAGDQVEFVLDDEIRRQERGRERASPIRRGGAVEPVLVVTVGTAQHGAGRAEPG